MFDWLKRKRLATPADDPARDAVSRRRQADLLLEGGDLATAIEAYLDLVQLHPDDTKALTSLGFALIQQGSNQQALQHLQRAAALDARSHDAHYMLGILHEAAGDAPQAIRHFETALALAPTLEPAALGLVRLLATTGQADAARAAVDEGLRHNPGSPDLHFFRGNLLLTAGQLAGAADCYARAIGIDPAHLPSLLQQATVLRRLGRLQEAVAAYRAASAASPDDAGILSDWANALNETANPAAAEEACRRALELDPQRVGAHINLAKAQFLLGRPAETVASYRRALELRPEDAAVWSSLGNVLNSLRRPTEALDAYARALVIDADQPWTYGAWLTTQLGICQWSGIEAEFGELARRLDAGRPAAQPFNMLAVPLSRRQQLACATTYVAHACFAPAAPLAPAAPGPRIRIGYFSADFHEHATAHLMAEMLERHDRSRFEIIAFSFGPRSTSAMRMRLEKAFDRFVDVLDLSDAETVARARAMPIDIAVDLKGYTQDCRPGIFAARAAPLQVNFLGYPGTMGAPFIDYLVADPVVIPPATAGDYSEKIVFLPHSYQPNDSQRPISPRHFTRAECGLPPQGFVFCCFNNNWKITPAVFAAWMRVLGAVPDSVLWLLQDNEFAAANLRSHAAAHGIDPRRLVFAPRMPMPEHLARHALADLFLDTLQYNAHTTASDALWAGVPLVTCMGEVFSSRVAGSLLHALGLAELATTSLAAYEALALDLARDPQRLRSLRARLLERRSTSPLFDGALFASHLEAGYAAMWARHLAGQPADHLVIPRTENQAHALAPEAKP